jgi:hypothetical protein
MAASGPRGSYADAESFGYLITVQKKLAIDKSHLVFKIFVLEKIGDRKKVFF